jgi:hypothetical protein
MLTADLHRATALPMTALNPSEEAATVAGNVFRFSSVISQNQKKGEYLPKAA